jgi:hypothetical protein
LEASVLDVRPRRCDQRITSQKQRERFVISDIGLSVVRVLGTASGVI